MVRTAGVLLVALIVFAACTSGEEGATTLPGVDGTRPAGSTSTAASIDGPGDSTSSTAGPNGTTTTPGIETTTSTTGGTASTVTTLPPTPTTKPNQDVPGGSTPVTDDSTPGGSGERPSDAEEVTVSSTQLFVIGGDTLYLVVEGTKVEACQRLDFITDISGSTIDIDLFSVPDDSFCTPSNDYKDSLALGTYGSGSWKIILNGNEVADADL